LQTLNKLKQDAKRPTERPTAEEHAQKMARLQKERFDLHKEISEAEANIDFSVGELAKTKTVVNQLQAKNVAEETEIDPQAYVTLILSLPAY
jgi:hypothetical protein